MDYSSNCPQNEQNYRRPEVRNLLCMCSTKVVCLFAAFLALAVGVIIGATIADLVLPALPAIIIFAVVMAIAILAVLIYRYCLCCKVRRCS